MHELRSFADSFESRALELATGPCVSLVQAALATKRFARSATWTEDKSALETAYQKATSWDTSDYPGLSHVLQMKLLHERPQLRTDNVESFLLYRESFLAAADDLFNHLPIQVPTTLKSSQLFIPCAFAITPMVASRFRQRNIPDCLGRSVSHVLYDAKSLKEWSPSEMYTIDNLRRTSLYLACCDGDHNRVQQLIRANVNPNVEASNCLYPLDIAVISGNLEICRTIWKMEIDVHEKYSKAETTICMDSRYNGSLGILRRSPMMWAAFFGHVHILKFFRNQGNNYPNATALMDIHCCNAIGLAAMRGQKKVIEYLSGYPCDVVDWHGRSPLWYAAFSGHPDILELLLKKDPFLNRQDNNGFTPLAIAAQKGHLQTVNYLRDMVDLSISTNTGHTPLSLATSARHLECVKSLLRPSIVALGALKVRKVFTVAQENGYHEICRVFRDHGLNYVVQLPEESTTYYLDTGEGCSDLDKVRRARNGIFQYNP